MRSPAQELAAAGPEAWAEFIAGLTPGEITALLSDWHGFLARPEQLVPDEPARWVAWITGRGFGKLADVDTPVPTPSGWCRLGDVQVGDVLYDETGRPTMVTGVYDDEPERAWRLGFSDGTSIVAGGEHLWTTWENADRKAWNRNSARTGGLPDNWPAWRAEGRWGHYSGARGPQTRTTDEIAATLTYGKRGDLNHSIPTTGPLAGVDARPALDPWLIGFWLGDGDTAMPALTIGAQDQPYVLGRLDRIGVCWSQWAGSGMNFGLRGLRPAFRAMGLLGNKHIPPKLLRGTVGQRLRLLRGLMDSDGYCDKVSGQAEFTTTSKALAVDVLELVRTLGERPVMGEGRATLRGMDHGPKWRIWWRPTRSVPFSLPRKAARVKPLGAQASRCFHRMIVAADQVPVRPMRCLSVDSPNRLFLLGEGMIPTHNTRSACEWFVDRCEQFADARWPHTAALIGQTYDDVSAVQLHGESGIEAVAERRGYYLDHAGSALKGTLTIPRAGYRHVTKIEVHTAIKPDKVRGRNLHTAHAEELASWEHKVDSVGNTAFTNLDFALRAECPPGLQPMGAITTTPKPIPQVRDITTGKLGGKIHIIRGSLMDNAANLPPEYVAAILAKYEGTRVALQEIYGVVLDFVEGALWTPDLIQQHRLNPIKDADLIPAFRRTVIGVDPSGSDGGDECGIIVVSLSAVPEMTMLSTGVIVPMHHVYIRHDASVQLRPAKWVPRVVELYRKYAADAVVLETNFGAAMGVDSIHQIDPMVNVVEVRASRGKVVRAEPVAMVYDQGRAHHIGHFSELEEQMATWVSTDKTSPDRMDALVWAVTSLLPEITQPPSRMVTPDQLIQSLPTGADSVRRSGPGSGLAA